MATTPARRASLLTGMLLLAACTIPPATRTDHAQPEHPAVSVEYIHPEKFADVGNREVPSDSLRAAYLDELGKHLTRKATPLLTPGQRLDVQITEVDMAGRFEPWRSRLADVRIVRDVYPPRIDLNFKLAAADGSIIREGKRQLRNPAFLMGLQFYPDDPLRYEKKLLDDWLEHELPQPRS